MSNSSENTKRIAKNTLMLYVRMLFSMIVSLYTSRVILATLGVEDYGISNVVGGVVSMFAFFSGSMATSTQRFLTFELGKGDFAQLKKVFSIALLIHFIIAIIVVFLAETIGLWFLQTKLVIPESRMPAAHWVYQFSVLSCFVSIIQVPYNASINAHEHFSFFAVMGIVEVLAKLAVVYLLVILPFDKLIWCSLLFFIVSYFIRLVYRFYCMKKFDECRFHWTRDKSLFKNLFSFAGWNVFGSMAWILRDQGVNMVLNLFFGPVVNAARGVAVQVSGAISGFVTNINTAFNPQITKHFAQKEVHNMEMLTYRASRFSFMMLFIIALPLILNIDFVLNIWLKEVPEHASSFVTLILIDSMVGCLFGSPFITSLLATGNIRNYQIVVGTIILLIVPAAYLALKLGGEPEFVFYIIIAISLIAGIARYGFCVKQIGFSPRFFIHSVIIPVAAVSLLSIPIPYFLSKLTYPSNVVKFFCVCVVAVVITSLAVIFLGLTKSERRTIWCGIKKRLTRQ